MSFQTCFTKPTWCRDDFKNQLSQRQISKTPVIIWLFPFFPFECMCINNSLFYHYILSIYLTYISRPLFGSLRTCFLIAVTLFITCCDYNFFSHQWYQAKSANEKARCNEGKAQLFRDWSLSESCPVTCCQGSQRVWSHWQGFNSCNQTHKTRSKDPNTLRTSKFIRNGQKIIDNNQQSLLTP